MFPLTNLARKGLTVYILNYCQKRCFYILASNILTCWVNLGSCLTKIFIFLILPNFIQQNCWVHQGQYHACWCPGCLSCRRSTIIILTVFDEMLLLFLVNEVVQCAWYKWFGSGHECAAVLSPDFAIKWLQNQVMRKLHLHDLTHMVSNDNGCVFLVTNVPCKELMRFWRVSFWTCWNSIHVWMSHGEHGAEHETWDLFHKWIKSL